MEPKLKAKELFDKYVELSGIFVGDYESEKEMCLILVDEMLNEFYTHPIAKIYWQEVKNEINKL